MNHHNKGYQYHIQILGDLLWSLWCRMWNRLGNHFSWFKLSHKNSVLNEQAHVGMEPSKLAKLDGNDTTTLSHHPDILFHFVNCTFCLLCATVHRSIVEGSGVGSAGCGVHVDVHGEWVMLWVAAIYWAWQIWSVLYVEFMSWVCIVCWSISYVVKFYCCWAWQIQSVLLKLHTDCMVCVS